MTVTGKTWEGLLAEAAFKQSPGEQANWDTQGGRQWVLLEVTALTKAQWGAS